MDDEQAKSNDQSPEHGSPSEPLATSSQAVTPWDDLARTLGAEPSPEALERPHLENAPPHQELPSSTKKPLPESPETPATEQTSAETGDTKTSDWGGLATELGITIDDSPEPANLDAASAGGDQDGGPSSQPENLAVPLEDKPREECPPEAWGDLPSFQEEEPAQVAFAEEPILPEDELDDTDPPVQKGLSGEVARNVFDALFLSGSAAAEAFGNLLPSGGSDRRKRKEISTDQQADPEPSESQQDEPEQPEGFVDQDALPPREESEKSASGRGSRRRRGRGRRRRVPGRGEEVAKEETSANPSETTSDPLDSPLVDPIAKAMSYQQEPPRADSPEELAPSSEESDDETRKSNSRRRRPRRRRGRGRGVATRETDDLTASREEESSSVPESESAATGHKTDPSTSSWEATAGEDPRNRQEPPASEEVDQKNITGEDGLDEEDESNGHRGSHSKRPSHRNIPTWEEAMSVIVDSNIESRKKSPTPTGHSGSSRNRGRGGRRRKKT